jgi:glycine cleavage system H protein
MSKPRGPGPEELPCVWVTAGVLSYRPCHREYDCDGCELYHALRGPGPEAEVASTVEEAPYAATSAREREPREGAAASSERRAADVTTPGPTRSVIPPAPEEDRAYHQAVSAYLTRLTGGCNLHLDRPYTPGHLWIIEEDGEVKVGLDCQTLRVLYPLDDFTLPRPGVWLKRGETMGWVQRGHLILPLTAPISGEVIEVNEALVDEIRRLGFPEKAAPWLLRLAPREPLDAVPDLLTGESMLHWYEGKLALLRNFLEVAVSLDPEVQEAVGPTLNDGGEPNLNLEEVLGPTLFQQLLERLFCQRE